MHWKIVVCLFVMVCWVSSPVYSSSTDDFTQAPLVVLAGTDYTRLLGVEGYEIVSSNVNWFEPNTYQVLYRIKNGSKTVQREVIVQDKFDFINRGYEYTRIKDQFFPQTNLDKEILSYLVINSNNMIIAYSEYNPVDQDAGSTIAIAWMTNNAVVWETTLRVESYDYVTKIILGNNEIVGVGVHFNEQYHQSGWLFRLDFDGTLLADQTYQGNNRNFFYDVVSFEDSYMVFGKSNSNQGIYVGKKSVGNDYDAMIGVINRTTMNLTNVMMYGSSGDDVFEEAIFCNQFLFLRTSTAGLVGDFADGINQRRSGIVKMNLAGQITRMNFISSISDMRFEALSISDRGTMYGVIGFDNNTTNRRNYQIYSIGQDASFIYMDEYAYSNTSSNIKLVDIQINEDDIILVHQLNKYVIGQTKQGYYIRTYKDEQLLEEYDYILEGSTIHPRGYLFGDSLQILGVYKPSIGGSKIAVFTTSRVNIHSLGGYRIDNDIQEIETHQIEINQEIIPYDRVLSRTNVNYQMFGYYMLQYVFRHETFVVAFAKEVYVADLINVSSDEHYSLGYRLFFNGVGYLNDKKISSGTQINQVGMYVLEIYGKDQVKRMISFGIIDNISNKQYHLVKLEKPAFLEIQTSSKETKSLMSITYISNAKPSSDWMNLSQFKHWFMFFPIVCLPTTILMITKGVKQ